MLLAKGLGRWLVEVQEEIRLLTGMCNYGGYPNLAKEDQ